MGPPPDNRGSLGDTRALRGATSPFTLYVDGVEWEPECITSSTSARRRGGNYECWMDDWDDDGTRARTEWRGLEEDNTSGTWDCVMW